MSRFSFITTGWILVLSLVIAGCSPRAAFPTSPTASPTQPLPTPTASPSPAPQPTQAVISPASTSVSAAPPNLQTVRIALEEVVLGLEMPVGLAHAGDGSRRLFVLEKRGRVRILADGKLLAAPFLDLTDRVGSSAYEQGLLGIAFHPDYAQNGYVFVNYTNLNGDTVVARFSVTDDPNVADPTSEVRVLWIDQPASNHNGGHLVFGPDGYLYVGMGDGGGAGDRYGNGQNGQTLLAKILRLDVDELPYTIPSDNPFVGDPNMVDEAWAYGLRNPWRFSFDRETGDLYIADVGQNLFEEVNFQPAGSGGGQNYGWPIMEGLYCYAAEECDPRGLTLPVAQYDHDEGCSITGGYVYRGQDFPSLRGIYFFGDFCSGIIWGMMRDEQGRWQVTRLLDSDLMISTFGEDEAGELYVADINGGVYRIIAP